MFTARNQIIIGLALTAPPSRIHIVTPLCLMETVIWLLKCMRALPLMLYVWSLTQKAGTGKF